MILNQLESQFPSLCEIANDKHIFLSDVDALSKLQTANLRGRDYVDAVYTSRNIQAKKLMEVLSFPLLAPDAAENMGSRIERDIELLKKAFDVPQLRRVFRSKLLTSDANQWIDTVHEIAVASTLLGFYDKGTMELEKLIPHSKNNSDTYGRRGGKPFRVDATVIHDEWPPLSAPDDPVIAYTRNTVDKAEIDDLLKNNPPGVVISAQGSSSGDNTHHDTPLSTKVWQVLDNKRRQCERGCVNIIAIGLLRPIDDEGARAAVLGVPFVSLNRSTSQATANRHHTGPFVPTGNSKDSGKFSDSFKILSAVWLTRWQATYPLSEILLNPNADKPLGSHDKMDLMRLGAECANLVV